MYHPCDQLSDIRQSSPYHAVPIHMEVFVLVQPRVSTQQTWNPLLLPHELILPLKNTRRKVCVPHLGTLFPGEHQNTSMS